jgi:hypothetical protein
LTAQAVDITRLVDVLESGDDLSADDRRAAADALRRLVLPSKQEQRYELIRKAVAEFLSHESAPADQFADRLAIYAGGRWIRERVLDECPRNRIGKIEGHFWQILKLRDCPLTGRHVRRILDI